MKSNSKNERRAPAKSRRFLAMFICAAVIAIAAAATALYLSKPEPASAEEAFFGAVNASGPYQAPPGAQGLGGFYENWRLGRIADGFASSSSDAAVELRASAAPSLYPAQLSAIVGSLLQDLSLTVSYKNDRETQKSLSSLAVNVSGKKLGAIDVLYDGAGRIGVSSPEIRPAPIIVSTDDLPGVLAAATGLEAPAGGLPQRGGPEMGSLLARLQALPGELALSREEYDSVMGPYFAMAEEMLGGDSFAVSEGATVDGAGGESYAMASAAISGADMKALALAALDRAQGDEALLGLIQDKYAAAYEFMASAAGAVPFAAVPDAGALLPSPESARGLAKAALLNARAAVEAYAPAAGAVFCADIYLDGDDRIRCVNVYARAQDGSRFGAEAWYKNYGSGGGQTASFTLAYDAAASADDLAGAGAGDSSGSAAASAGAGAGAAGARGASAGGSQRATLQIVSEFGGEGGQGSRGGQGGDGRHRVEASLDAPVSSLGAASSFFAPGRLTAVASWELSRQGGSDSARLIAGTRAPDGGITPSLELLLEASEQGGGSGSGGGGGSGGNGGGSYVLAAELGLYDSARRQAGAGESAGAAGEESGAGDGAAGGGAGDGAGENADGSAGSGAGGGAGGLPAGSRLTGGAEPMLALSAEATVTFGPVSVPNLADAELAYGGAGGAAQAGGSGGADGAAGGNAGESGAAPASGTAYLTAESFSDGTAEALMADVQNGLMGFAFSNLQLFSQYINLQDLY